MAGLRWRVGALCAVLSAAVVCFCLQPAGIVTAEDKSDKSAVNGEAAGSADQDASSDKAPSSKKTKKNDANSKKKASKKTPAKKSQSKSGQQPATGGQGTGSSSGGSVGGGAFGANGGNAGTGAGSTSTGGVPADAGAGGGGPGAAAAMQDGKAPDPKDVEKAMAAQEKHSATLMKQEGIIGTSTGLDEDGKVVVRVLTNGAGKPQVPVQLDGVSTRVTLRGPIHKYDGFAGLVKYNPKKKATRPVPIGISSINVSGLGCELCATGTLGCRLVAKDGSGFYALSNNHVFALENEAAIGSPAVQPGPYDNNCVCSTDDTIGKLFKFKPIDFSGFNRIDAAVIRTTDKLISNATLPDGYGVPRVYTIKQPVLGMKVMKYGRTTGFTKGTIIGVNAIFFVGYDTGLALFRDQFEVVGDDGQAFGNPGDSGSLVVDKNRFPIGLLFAGGGGITDCNPIQPVLDFFGMTIDGDDSQDISPPGKVGSTEPK